jgi:heparin binding hemagglutinin HbhA
MPTTPTLPTTADLRKAREAARKAMASAFEQARTPLYAVIGAGDATTKVIFDAVGKARTQVTESAEAAKTAVDELPTDVATLREKLDPTELRKLVDQVVEAANKLYKELAAEGEKTVGKLRSEPRIKKAVEQFDQAAQTAQQRAEKVVDDTRELADEVLGKIVRRTRSTGEKAALAAVEATEELAAEVAATGEEVAHELRSTTRKAANKVNSVRKPTGAATTRKTTPKSTG